ncbi:hypothetical protein K5F93_12030 [Pseudomonas protegens]|uniref:hypothetical protein n=1 Tax=Pseudomonas protegens TaxID=380021 RepID=UPI001C8D42F1|nr:hypothetical protein [Pseudomonas protegens]QZI72927.1 hypothetical protein K5F93_12030 [Pseudomonas protegens]
MTIRPIDVGEEPNDETGDTLRDGGIIINENFAELDTRTAAAQEMAEQGVTDAAHARAPPPTPRFQDLHSDFCRSTGQRCCVPASQLPSFVDDVWSFQRGSISLRWVRQENLHCDQRRRQPDESTRQYRWSGSAYVLIPSSPGSTDQVPEGSTNQYFTAARVRTVTLAGLVVSNAVVVDTDSLLSALGSFRGRQLRL